MGSQNYFDHTSYDRPNNSGKIIEVCCSVSEDIDMCANVGKCDVMTIGRNNNDDPISSPIYWNDVKIKHVDQYEYLGVVIDYELS